MYSYLFLFFLAVGGLAVLIATVTRPHLAWVMLFASGILTCGLMPFGLTIVDEYFAVCIVFGCLISIFLTRETRMRFDPDPVAQAHLVFFLIFMVFLILQSVRGMVVISSPRKIRWVVFYILTGLLPVLLNTRRFPLPSRSQVLLTVLISTSIYNSIYILHGFLSELLFNLKRWDLQLTWWGTSAYTMFPAVVGIPAAILSIRSKVKSHRRLGYLTLLLIVVAGFYYDSRVTVLALFGFLAVSLPLIGLKRFVVGAALFTAIFALFISIVWSGRSVDFYFYDLFKGVPLPAFSEKRIHRPGMEDKDRYAFIEISYKSIDQDLSTLLFGHGFRQHGMVISPLLREYYFEHHLDNMAKIVPDDASAEGFTAYLVDTGLLGMALLLINMFLVGWQILRRRLGWESLVLVSPIGMMFLWLFVINTLDAILFYAAIMPSGILLLLAQREETTPSPRPERQPNP